MIIKKKSFENLIDERIDDRRNYTEMENMIEKFRFSLKKKKDRYVNGNTQYPDEPML